MNSFELESLESSILISHNFTFHTLKLWPCKSFPTTEILKLLHKKVCLEQREDRRFMECPFRGNWHSSKLNDGQLDKAEGISSYLSEILRPYFGI